MRLGLLVFVAGSVLGGMMIHNLQHTVGAPNDGPGLPGLGWSIRAGDLRLNRRLIAQLPAVRRLHPHFGGKLLVELHPALSEETLVSREKAPALKAWLEG